MAKVEIGSAGLTACPRPTLQLGVGPVGVIVVDVVAPIRDDQLEGLNPRDIDPGQPARSVPTHHTAVVQFFAVAENLKRHAAPAPGLVVQTQVRAESGAGAAQVIFEGGGGMNAQAPVEGLPAEAERPAVAQPLLTVALVEFHWPPPVAGRHVGQVTQKDIGVRRCCGAGHCRVAPVGVIVRVVVAAVTDREAQLPDPGHAHGDGQAPLATAAHAAVEQQGVVAEHPEAHAAPPADLVVDAHEGREGAALTAQRVPDLGGGMDPKSPAEAAATDVQRGTVSRVLPAVAAVPFHRSPAVGGRGPRQPGEEILAVFRGLRVQTRGRCR